MGNQNKPSPARKRLSQLAVTTTLAAVGIGVVGTGAANAATPASTPISHDASASTTTTAAVKVAVTDKTATADLSGVVIDGAADVTKATVSVDWGDGTNADSVAVTAEHTLAHTSLNHTYMDNGVYKVMVTVDDGLSTTKATASQKIDVGIVAPMLKAAVSTVTPTKGSPVVVSLKDSVVDKTAAAKTTISWGDKTTESVLLGDPSKVMATDPKLSHTYAAVGSYTLTVTLDDGLGNDVKTETFAVTVSVPGAVTVKRAAGNDRYDTGLIISQHQWADQGPTTPDALGRTAKAQAVVLATGNAFPDALAGVPLAKKANGPLLLTNGTAATTNPAVLAEIKRVLPTKGTTVYILGGEKAISAGIEAELKLQGYTTKRLAGEDRFGTALKIAQEGMDNPSHVIVARGDEGDSHNGFADALAAGPYATNIWGGGNSAVVLSNNKVLDPATAAYVGSKIKADQLNVAAVGGQADAAVKMLPGAVELHMDSTGKAVGNFAPAVGKDRYDTSRIVAAGFLPAGAHDKVGVATGLRFPDALTGGAYMATVGGPLLLTDPKVLPSYTLQALTGVAATTPEIDIFGGSSAVSDSVATAIAAVVKVTAIGKF